MSEHILLPNKLLQTFKREFIPAPPNMNFHKKHSIKKLKQKKLCETLKGFSPIATVADAH